MRDVIAMVGIISQPDTRKKLEILSADSQYDLACACSANKDEHRTRSSDGRWVYPVTLPNGGKSTLFKTLISNVCTNDCKYCPLRQQEDVHRCSLGVAETAKVYVLAWQLAVMDLLPSMVMVAGLLLPAISPAQPTKLYPVSAVSKSDTVSPWL